MLIATPLRQCVNTRTLKLSTMPFEAVCGRLEVCGSVTNKVTEAITSLHRKGLSGGLLNSQLPENINLTYYLPSKAL